MKNVKDEQAEKKNYKKYKLVSQTGGLAYQNLNYCKCFHRDQSKREI